ncbi:hypothetical protein [Brevundimonas sp.]|uniref:hypothetical protein n=1 Tax=Brevundimonas sp. TaxID=1871086 RepID=UPI0035B4D3A3
MALKVQARAPELVGGGGQLFLGQIEITRLDGGVGGLQQRLNRAGQPHGVERRQLALKLRDLVPRRHQIGRSPVDQIENLAGVRACQPRAKLSSDGSDRRDGRIALYRNSLDVVFQRRQPDALGGAQGAVAHGGKLSQRWTRTQNEHSADETHQAFDHQDLPHRWTTVAGSSPAEQRFPDRSFPARRACLASGEGSMSPPASGRAPREAAQVRRNRGWRPGATAGLSGDFFFCGDATRQTIEV